MTSSEPILKPIPRPRRPYAALSSLVIYLLLVLVPPTLKLAGQLARWSWWQVTSPLWVVYCLIGLVGFGAVMWHWGSKALDEWVINNS
jgi:nucleoside recognition membrane protein YjiH